MRLMRFVENPSESPEKRMSKMLLDLWAKCFTAGGLMPVCKFSIFLVITQNGAFWTDSNYRKSSIGKLMTLKEH